MGSCFQQNGQRGPQGSRVQTEAVPATPRKGRRPGTVPFGPWPGLLERLCVVAPFFWGPVNAMKEQLEKYVKRVKKRHQDCRNEQATKQALIAPLFAVLGYDLADPGECKPEYRTDFGKGEKAAFPVDWAFLIDGAFA